MVHMEETELPGVGVRYDFEALSGKRVGVLTHRDGRREMFIAGPEDGAPDGSTSITLGEDEAARLADLLGSITITRRTGTPVQDVEGLVMDWLGVRPDSRFAGRPLGTTRMRTSTGVSVVAVMRGTKALPAPGPEFVLQAKDVAVVIGTPEGVARAAELFERG